MTTRLRWAGTTTRLIVGTAVAAAFVAGTATGVRFAWPTHDRVPVAIDAVPAPSDTVLACDGPLLAIGRNAQDAAALSVAAPQSTTSAPGGDAPAPTPATLTVTGQEAVTGPTTFVAPPSGDTRTDLAAAGSATATDGDLSGFAASACAPPLMESWLVGGSSSTGASDLVLVSNPGAVAATVTMTVFTVDGPEVPASGRDLIIAPGTQRVIPLAALALGEEGPVVQVSASGAPVQAALQSSITRTLIPGGVDQVGAIAESAPAQTIPGVVVTAEPGAVGASSATTVARLLAPSAATTATITVTPASGAGTIEPTQVPLQAGVPVEVELGGLPVGTYTVRVTADAPVVAAVWQATGFGEGDDFAWYAAAPEISVDSLVAVAPGPTPTAVIANDGDNDATVTLTPVDGGAPISVTVPAHASATSAVTAGAVYTLSSGTEPVYAGIVYAGAGALAGYAVWPADAASAPLTVYP